MARTKKTTKRTQPVEAGRLIIVATLEIERENDELAAMIKRGVELPRSLSAFDAIRSGLRNAVERNVALREQLDTADAA